MPDELTFLMGKFEAHFPTDRRYARNHMWALDLGGKAWRFGFSAYAVRLLQDVYFLEWSVDPSTQLKDRQQIGSIESSKAESDLYTPLPGTLTAFNEKLLADPSAINTDKYGEGWLFDLTGDDGELLSPQEYLEHLEAVWPVAQRTIKGQMNE